MKFRYSLLALFGLLLLGMPALAQSPTTFFADRSDTAITVENAGDVTQLARIGRGTINKLVWSPDGETLAVGSSIGVWLYAADDLTAEPILLSSPGAQVRSVAYNPDGSRLIAGCSDSSVRVWDTDSNELLQTLEVPYSAEFDSVASDGSVIVGAALNTVIIWDAESGELRFTLNTTNQITSIAFAPDTPVIAASDIEDVITLYNTTSGEQIESLTDIAGFSNIGWLDGERLVRGTSVGWRVLNATTGETLLNIPSTISVASLAVGEDIVIAGGATGQIEVWNAATGEAATTFDAGEFVSALALSPDGETLAVVALTTLQLWSTEDQTQTAELTGVHPLPALGAMFNPDGEHALISYFTKEAIEYDLEEGVSTFSLANVLPDVQGARILTYQPNGQGLMYSDGIDILVRLSADSTLRLDIPNLPMTATFTPDGNVIATGDASGTIQLWNAEDGELLATLNDHTNGITSLSFSADGTLLLSSSYDGTVRLYGIADE